MRIYPYYIVQYREPDGGRDFGKLQEKEVVSIEDLAKEWRTAKRIDRDVRCYVVRFPGSPRRGLDPEETAEMMRRANSGGDRIVLSGE